MVFLVRICRLGVFFYVFLCHFTGNGWDEKLWKILQISQDDIHGRVPFPSKVTGRRTTAMLRKKTCVIDINHGQFHNSSSFGRRLLIFRRKLSHSLKTTNKFITSNMLTNLLALVAWVWDDSLLKPTNTVKWTDSYYCFCFSQ